MKVQHKTKCLYHSMFLYWITFLEELTSGKNSMIYMNPLSRTKSQPKIWYLFHVNFNNHTAKFVSIRVHLNICKFIILCLQPLKHFNRINCMIWCTYALVNIEQVHSKSNLSDRILKFDSKYKQKKFEFKLEIIKWVIRLIESPLSNKGGSLMTNQFTKSCWESRFPNSKLKQQTVSSYICPFIY